MALFSSTPKTKKFSIFPVISNLAAHAQSFIYRRKQKLITQLIYNWIIFATNKRKWYSTKIQKLFEIKRPIYVCMWV